MPKQKPGFDFTLSGIGNKSQNIQYTNKGANVAVRPPSRCSIDRNIRPVAIDSQPFRKRCRKASSENRWKNAGHRTRPPSKRHGTPGDGFISSFIHSLSTEREKKNKYLCRTICLFSEWLRWLRGKRVHSTEWHGCDIRSKHQQKPATFHLVHRVDACIDSSTLSNTRRVQFVYICALSMQPIRGQPFVHTMYTTATICLAQG